MNNLMEAHMAKRLSDRLSDLSARAKNIEDAVAAALRRKDMTGWWHAPPKRERARQLQSTR